MHGSVNHRTQYHTPGLTLDVALCYIIYMTLDTVTPASPEKAETIALGTVMGEFTTNGADPQKIEYLQHRYAGFNMKDSGTLAKVSIRTINKWIRDDPRVERFDKMVTSGERKGLRKSVLEEDWYRNYYLIMQRDAYIARKAMGLLEEPVLEYDANGGLTKTTTGSPPMTKEDWNYFGQMRKMYTPEAWSTIEKVISGQSEGFNISKFVFENMGHVQVNINAPS